MGQNAAVKCHAAVSWVCLVESRELGIFMTQENTSEGKIIRVVGAAIVRDGTVLCAQRGKGKSLAGYWEFPGGKIEARETAREALHREIEEELLCEVEVGEEVCTSTQQYAFGTVELTTFICHLLSGTPRLTEHHKIQWLTPADMPSLDWAPADCEAVELISNMDFNNR